MAIRQNPFLIGNLTPVIQNTNRNKTPREKFLEERAKRLQFDIRGGECMAKKCTTCRKDPCSCRKSDGDNTSFRRSGSKEEVRKVLAIKREKERKK